MPFTDRRLYSTSAWRKVRRIVIDRDGGLCVICRSHGVVVPGSDVDHIKPLRTHPDLALVVDNLRLLCKSCHSLVTRAADNPTPEICDCGYPMHACVRTNRGEDR